MKNKTFVEDAEYFEFICGIIFKVYGKKYSVKQLEEAREIAELTSDLFKDSLEKIYSQKYGRVATEPTPSQQQSSNTLQEKLDALWTIHSCYVEDIEKRCKCGAVLQMADYFVPERHSDDVKLQNALKTIFPQK